MRSLRACLRTVVLVPARLRPARRPCPVAYDYPWAPLLRPATGRHEVLLREFRAVHADHERIGGLTDQQSPHIGDTVSATQVRDEVVGWVSECETHHVDDPQRWFSPPSSGGSPIRSRRENVVWQSCPREEGSGPIFVGAPCVAPPCHAFETAQCGVGTAGNGSAGRGNIGRGPLPTYDFANRDALLPPAAERRARP